DVQDTVAVGISEEYLKKILEELIDNACKFSDPGTSISVRAWTQGEHYLIQITDLGRGMTQDHWENLGAYMQFDRRVYEQQGIGLGLVIAKRLTELHNGTIDFVSSTGQGTTVTVALPLRSESPAQAHHSGPAL
ncbi:MAG TPA: ATP-binding protein, partial [Candidatus Limnocylindrales bacterium]|nr:ATP-binding protein [Candidatus Limnocylindrales bacterium]